MQSPGAGGLRSGIIRCVEEVDRTTAARREAADSRRAVRVTVAATRALRQQLRSEPPPLADLAPLARRGGELR